MKYTPSLSVLFTIMMICAPIARGAEPDAKELFRQAEGRFASGEFSAALDLYQRAYQLKPLPGFHFNMGQCLRSLGKFEEAIEQFRLYLEKSDPPKHRPEAEALIKACEEELQRAQEERRLTQASPASAPVDPGVGAGGLPRTDSRRKLPQIYFWSGVGLTGALAITGTITGALSLGKSSSYKDPSTPREELQGLKDSGESLRTASTVTFILALAAAAGTAVTYFYTDFGSSGRLVSAAALPGGGALILGGQF